MMTANQLTSPQHRNTVIAIALIIVFAIAAMVLTRPQTHTSSLSPVSGLITLKASAQSAMPYEQAMKNPNPTLIEFYADWCTTCQRLAPTLASVHDELGSELNFVMLDIDDPQWRSQIQQFHVSGVPHLVLLNADQSIADSFVGNVPASILRDRLTHLLG
ncbi:MAG: thioredoxin domain-containing protein [Leptolyngbyaceae bacterium]|nr:thioredoxin domain-containing protein [Leptolyngbyaceae bacterium]